MWIITPSEKWMCFVKSIANKIVWKSSFIQDQYVTSRTSMSLFEEAHQSFRKNFFLWACWVLTSWSQWVLFSAPVLVCFDSRAVILSVSAVGQEVPICLSPGGVGSMLGNESCRGSLVKQSVQPVILLTVRGIQENSIKQFLSSVRCLSRCR